ncbi:MAG: VWA domain-containing protein [Bryobacteraceae bacterium]|jgi:VWFA-related protein
MPTLRLLILSAVTLAPMLAQEPDTQPTIKVEVDVVSVLASVRNKQGGLVGNLAKDAFVLSEDGKPQTIKYFTRETDLPLTIGLLVDVSRSQERLIDIERDAASQFFSQVLHPKDLAFLISFGEECELLQDYTSSARLLRAGLSGLKVNAPVAALSRMPGPVPTVYQPRGTVLYDAVFLAADEKLRGQVGRKVLVLVTDGVDMGSRLKIEDALRSSQKADAIIYSIDYEDPSAYGGRFGLGIGGGMGESTLRRMSEQTGGRVFRIGRKHPLSEAFEEIQAEMRSQYAIGYTPINPVRDGSFRRIDLKTTDKDLKVQARKGYFASKPEE